MKNFVMNEKKFAEELLSGDGYGSNSSYTTTIMAKYFKSQGQSNKKIRESLNKLIGERIPNSPPVGTIYWNVEIKRWIDRAVSIAGKYPLYEFDKITITKPEMEVVNSIRSEKFRDYRIRRLAFALLCFAKFEEARGKKDGWVNFDTRDIFAAADLKGMTNSKQNLLIHELYKAGYIDISHVIRTHGNIGIRVMYIKDGETELSINNVNEVGKIFRQYNGEKVIRCERCGKLVCATGRRMKYCPNCASVINKEKSRDRKKKRVVRKFDL